MWIPGMNTVFRQHHSSPGPKVWLYLTWPDTLYFLVDKTWNLFPLGARVLSTFSLKYEAMKGPSQGKRWLWREQEGSKDEVPMNSLAPETLGPVWCKGDVEVRPHVGQNPGGKNWTYLELWPQRALGLLRHDRPISHPLLGDANHIGWQNNRGRGSPPSGTPGLWEWVLRYGFELCTAGKVF